MFEATATPRTSGGLNQTPGIKVRKMKSAQRTPTTFNDDCMQIASMSVGYLHPRDRGGNFSLTLFVSKVLTSRLKKGKEERKNANAEESEETQR